MSLIKGSSHEVISKNIHEMIKSGKPLKQAIATSLANAHHSKMMNEGGIVHDIHDPNQPEQGNIGGGDNNAMAGEPVYTQNDADDGLSDLVMDAEESNSNLQKERMAANSEPLSEDVKKALSDKKAKRRFS